MPLEPEVLLNTSLRDCQPSLATRRMTLTRRIDRIKSGAIHTPTGYIEDERRAGTLFGMTSTKFAGMVSGGRFQGLLTLVLVVALLLCHGALGAHHQAHQTSTGELEQASGHASHEHDMGVHGVGAGGHSEGSESDCSSCVAYFAVLLVVSLGALLWLLRGARSWTSNAGSLSFPLRFVSPVPQLPRGPVLPVLQVFRL
jgi:hypothetical protein